MRISRTSLPLRGTEKGRCACGLHAAREQKEWRQARLTGNTRMPYRYEYDKEILY